MWHLATPFLVFSSFLDLTISGHVTQNSDVLRNKKIKFNDFSEAAKFWKGLVNFHKDMIIIRFYANYSLRRHAYAHEDFFAFSYFPRTIADWSASEAILSSASLETFKSNFSACTAHLLLRITRWPPLKRAFEVTPLKWSRLKRNAIGIFTCGCFLPRWDSMSWECA